MKVVIDTNIVLDVVGSRQPFFVQSHAVMQLVAEGKVGGAITANTVTDIYYVLRKHLDNQVLKAALRGLMELVEVLDVNGEECLAALDIPMKDYEDALLTCCAKNWKADYIITRNRKDFVSSPVKAISPDNFLKKATAATSE